MDALCELALAVDELKERDPTESAPSFLDDVPWLVRRNAASIN
jgi:hypothetical protein